MREVLRHQRPRRALPAGAGFVWLVVGLAAAPGRPVAAQNPDSAVADAPPSSSPVRLFLDCTGRYCDDEHIRRETPYVDHVRDRHDADVYLYVATQPAGGADGSLFTLAFEGRGRFDGLTDTVRVATPPEPTFASGRSTLTRAIAMGLMRYVVRTDVPGEVRIGYAPPAAVGAVTSSGRERDPWNAWVFQVGADATADGEQRYRFLNLSGRVSANRTTEAWKVRLGGRASRFEQRFEFEDGEELVDRRTSSSVDALLVKSLSDHLSAGGTASARQSTRGNIDHEARAALALEANLFSYRDASHREFIFLYEVGGTWVAYEEVTIFDEREESLIRHALTSRLNLIRPWGFVSLTLYGEQLSPARWVPDVGQIEAGDAFYELSLDATFSLNVARGLSIDFTGGYSKIGNQRHLPRGGATPEEVILRRRELETGFRYTLTVGVSYTFGSIYNNVVNPRFR